MKKSNKVVCLVRASEELYEDNAHARYIVIENEQRLPVEAVQTNIDNMVAHYGPEVLAMIQDILEIKLGRKAV